MAATLSDDGAVIGMIDEVLAAARPIGVHREGSSATPPPSRCRSAEQVADIADQVAARGTGVARQVVTGTIGVLHHVFGEGAAVDQQIGPDAAETLLHVGAHQPGVLLQIAAEAADVRTRLVPNSPTSSGVMALALTPALRCCAATCASAALVSADAVPAPGESHSETHCCGGACKHHPLDHCGLPPTRCEP